MAGGPATIPIHSGRRRWRWDKQSVELEAKRLRHKLGLLAHWWLRPHRTFQPVFVLTTHRSGSNLLVDYLNRLEGVFCQSEILCSSLPIGPRLGHLSTRRALLHIRMSLQSCKTPVRGAKLMLDQLAGYRLRLDHLHSAFPTARYIVLYRQSIAEQYLSRKSAKATNQWVLLPGDKRKTCQVVVDPGELRAYAEETRQAYREVLECSWLPERAVLLSYEELTEAPAHWICSAIAPLLGVPPREPKTCHRKQNTQPVAERVANYREVAALLNSPLCRQQYVWPWQQRARRQAA